jgi:biotin synthase
LVGREEAVAMARHNASKGVRRFSLVTSGRAMSDAGIEKACAIFDAIRKETDISLCASMGLLSKPQLARLREHGVGRYHCNLETAPSFFPSLCTTHTIEDKIRTIEWAQEAGMEVCSGGIIGMGENLEQRVELAVTLRELGVRSIPVNILNPIPGTRLASVEPLTDEELLRSFAMFRIVCPDAHIRFAGGRLQVEKLERQLLHSGVSASIMGDMLTTCGSSIDRDKAMFAREGFTV